MWRACVVRFWCTSESETLWNPGLMPWRVAGRLATGVGRVVATVAAMIPAPSGDVVVGLSAEATAEVDGDKIDVRAAGGTERVRIVGIDTPEIGRNGAVDKCCAQEAPSTSTTPSLATALSVTPTPPKMAPTGRAAAAPRHHQRPQHRGGSQAAAPPAPPRLPAHGRCAPLSRAETLSSTAPTGLHFPSPPARHFVPARQKERERGTCKHQPTSSSHVSARRIGSHGT